MTQRRPKVARAIAPSRTPFERAAIAICKMINHQQCPCERAPSVCDLMVSAARIATSITAPEVFERVKAADTPAMRGPKR
jgi:hypothetical protein